jgi:signal peptidase I
VKLRTLLDYAIVAVVAVAFALLLQAYVVKPYAIPSGSMLGTLRPGDRVLVNRVVYRLHEPHRGDVIVFKYPRDTHVAFIKRVVGVPGDVLQVHGGRLYVNGSRLDERYVHRTNGAIDPTDAAGPIGGTTMSPPWSLARPFTVPHGAYFVMGDNRTNSDDSRDWGVVPRADIIGEGFVTYWPVSRWGVL